MYLYLCFHLYLYLYFICICIFSEFQHLHRHILFEGQQGILDLIQVPDVQEHSELVSHTSESTHNAKTTLSQYPSLPGVQYLSLKFIIRNNTLLQITSVSVESLLF